MTDICCTFDISDINEDVQELAPRRQIYTRVETNATSTLGAIGADTISD